MTAIHCGHHCAQSSRQGPGDGDADRAPDALGEKMGGKSGRGRGLRSESGQGVVEFAMVLPLIAALVLIFIQFGKAINYWIDLTHVANEAARVATVNAPGVANFKTEVCNYLETSELKNGSNEVDAAHVDLSYPGSTRLPGQPVRVKVSATYHWLPYFNVGTWSIQGSATMRLERDTTSNAALNTINNQACP